MLPHELDSAVDVWRKANIVRGAPHGPERTARVRAKLSASDTLPFVALRLGIVGMALTEPGKRAPLRSGMQLQYGCFVDGGTQAHPC
jgi:hypothetical protein